MTLTGLPRGLLFGIVTCSALMLLSAWGIWFERKLAARMQSRLGPTRVGPAGLLQPLADLFKLLAKEHLMPQGGDAVLFQLAPPLALALALGASVVVPFSPESAAADLDVGVLFILAIGALMVVPVWLAGWASQSKYALLGGMRAVAQSISYEVPLVLAAMVPIILAGSLRVGTIVQHQAHGHWYALWPIIPGLPAFILFVLSLLAESNRIPFDIPEAESELVAGVTTEYSGMSFGLLSITEYVHTLVASAVGSALFLGGWDGPFAPGFHWMILKTLALFGVIYVIRWSLLRFRSDQLMDLCWRKLVPLGVVLVLLAAVWVQLPMGKAS